MTSFTKGRYSVQQANNAAERADIHALRSLCFGVADPFDVDGYDDRCTHVMIKDTASGTIVCCYRLLALQGGDVSQSYAAQFYDLTALRSYDGLMMELGRFCVHPDWHDPDIVRLAWAALTDFVDSYDVQMLFGCSSFEGTDKSRHLDAFAMLKARHLGPDSWRPHAKSPDAYRFAAESQGTADAKRAMAQMPPLLRTYLLMGGWVSDHAVYDHELNTMHVFTGLEIGMIPENRKRLLRALV